jgi:hypothetical protein
LNIHDLGRPDEHLDSREEGLDGVGKLGIGTASSEGSLGSHREVRAAQVYQILGGKLEVGTSSVACIRRNITRNLDVDAFDFHDVADVVLENVGRY